MYLVIVYCYYTDVFLNEWISCTVEDVYIRLNSSLSYARTGFFPSSNNTNGPNLKNRTLQTELKFGQSNVAIQN